MKIFNNWVNDYVQKIIFSKKKKKMMNYQLKYEIYPLFQECFNNFANFICFIFNPI